MRQPKQPPPPTRETQPYTNGHEIQFREIENCPGLSGFVGGIQTRRICCRMFSGMAPLRRGAVICRNNGAA